MKKTSLVVLLALVWACSPEDPPQDDCANLRQLHSSSGANVSGTFGVLDEFGFAGSGESGYTVIPPDTSDCARDLAAKLEGACRICDAAPNACQSTVAGILDQPTDACTACGDGQCQSGETPALCPEDCGTACGNGTCDGDESSFSCPEDCGTACGDGTCDGDESATACPQDCGTACGDSTCEPGETPTNCPRDCGAPCGNHTCEPGESPLRCPQDCGGCTPNSSECEDPQTQITCDSNGLSSTRRTCGQNQACREGSCQANTGNNSEDEVAQLLLGQWRVTVFLFDQNQVDRRVDSGNAIYTLEIFAVEPPSDRFGIWSWRGALRAQSLCVVPGDEIEAGGGACQAYQPTALGTCSGATCTERLEAAARGTYDIVNQELEMTSGVTEANTFWLSGQGWVYVDLNLSFSGALREGELARGACARDCSWTLRGSGAYGDTHPYRSSNDWEITAGKLTGN